MAYSFVSRFAAVEKSDSVLDLLNNDYRFRIRIMIIQMELLFLMLVNFILLFVDLC